MPSDLHLVLIFGLNTQICFRNPFFDLVVFQLVLG
jgi:hypothetical protein